MRRRFLPIAFLALLALFAAACGSKTSGSSGGGGSIPAGASLVRAGLVGFVSIDSDTGSGQWQQLDKLAQKFPGRDKAIAKLKREISKHGVDYERDVKPALGPELDLAIVSGGTQSSTRVVGLTKPDDPAKFKALVAKLNASDSGGGNAVYREVDGWYALSDSQAAIASVLKGDRTALAGDATFKQAFDKLPADALVKAFVDGERVNALVSQAASSAGGKVDPSMLGLGNLKYLAASASAEDNGLRIRGASSGGPDGGDLSAKLADGVPGDAFALLDFSGQGTTDRLNELKSNPQLGPAIRQMQQALGVTLEQVLALLQGEIAFYARPGAGIPELTLVLEEADQSAALATLDKLMAHLAAASGGTVEPGTQGGHEIKTAKLGNFAIHYGGLDGKVVLTSGVNGIADYGSGDHLPDSADFKEAQDAAGMPDSTGGFAYVDLKDALPLIEGFASLAGRSLPSETTENLRPLRSFLAWSEGAADSRTFDAFLEIK
jgi:hypothetical protein